MGSKKTTSTTVNKAPQFVEQPKNPFYDEYRKSLDNLDLTSGVKHSYGRLRNEISESGNEIFGANTSPEMADKVRQSRMFRATIDEGRDLSNSVQQENQIKSGGFITLGEATKPIAYNPGGTNTVVQPFDWGGLAGAALGAGASVASAGSSSLAGSAVKA